MASRCGISMANLFLPPLRGSVCGGHCPVVSPIGSTTGYVPATPTALIFHTLIDSTTPSTPEESTEPTEPDPDENDGPMAITSAIVSVSVSKRRKTA